MINVNNLRDAIDLAKRVVTKEKLDRQLTGQSSTPFMRMTSSDNYSTQINNKKGETFDAMETLERNSNCIDRLTSLVSEMKMAMDRKQSPYKPRIYQGRSRNQNINRQNFAPRNRSFSGGRNQNGNRGNCNYRNNYRHNDRNRSRGRFTITRLAIDEVILDQITDKMLNAYLEIEVKVEIELEITTMTIQEVEVGIEIMTGHSVKTKYSISWMRQV